MRFVSCLLFVLSSFIYRTAIAVDIVEQEPTNIHLASILDINGKEFTFDKLEDNVLVLHFWATWCSGCVQEMEYLNGLQKILKKDKVIILPISEDFKGDSVIREFYKTYGLTNLVAFLDKNQKLFHELEVASLPATFILDTSGQIVASAKGAVNWLEEENISLLKKYIRQKNMVNIDYINLLDKQKMFEKNVEPVHNAWSIDDLVPKAAQTELEVAESSNFKIGEIKVTNIKGDTSSFKIKRPVNNFDAK